MRLEEIETYPIVVFEQESGVGMDFSEEIALLDLRRTGRIIYIKDLSLIHIFLSALPSGESPQTDRALTFVGALYFGSRAENIDFNRPLYLW